MIPEFVDATDAIQASLTKKTLDAHAELTSEFRKAKKIVFFEGEGHGILSGNESEASKFHHIESGIEFRLEDLIQMTPEDFERRFIEMGKELGEKANAIHWGIIREATERNGAVITRKKDDSVIESISMMVEKASMSFENGGHGYSLHVPPSDYDAVVEAQNAICECPELSKRMNQLMQQKYEQWRAEEANRKLVD
jgi:hypothetical protein